MPDALACRPASPPLRTGLWVLGKHKPSPDVVVIAAGEMGRSPRIGKSTGATNAPNGRDHWETGFALMAGGGIANGRVVGETDRHADRAKGKPFTPQNLLAT